MNDQDSLCHFGVLGMKWGKRKDRKAAKKSTMKSYRQDKGPKRFKVMNAANSAARSHYRSQRTGSFKTYRNQLNKATLKEGRLTESQIKNGRYRVARARSIKRNAASVAIGSLAGAGALAAVAATGGAALPGILAAGGATSITTVVSHFTTGAHYYGRQRKAYGGTRAKYQNQKGVTK